MFRFFKAFRTRPRSEEESLAEDMNALDHSDPSWDSEARFAGAVAAVRIGTSPRLIELVYGPALLARALAEAKNGVPERSELKRSTFGSDTVDLEASSSKRSA